MRVNVIGSFPDEMPPLYLFISSASMKKINALLLLITMFTGSVFGQQDNAALSTALNRRIIEVQSINNTDTAEFPAFKNLLSGAKVIGLGEGTHGTKEFYQYKAGLIKYLVLHGDLRILIFECDMVGMEIINDYVLNKINQPLSYILRNSSLFDIYRTQEVADLLEWIKAYNFTQPADRQVRIAGMDANMPYHIASKFLKSIALGPYLDAQMKKDLAEIRSMSAQRNFGQARKKYLMGVADKLRNIVKDNLSADSLEIYNHCVRLLIQSLTMINLGDIPLNSSRDAHMAENVLWSTGKTSENEKLAIWGHNGHICADKWRGYPATGMHLRRKLKDRYYALGLAVGEGYARLWDWVNKKPFHPSKLPAIVNPAQFEFVLKGLKYPNFFLDLSLALPDKTLAAYFKQPLLTRVVGAGVVNSEKDILLPVRVDKAYDGMLFFRETTAATDIWF